MSNRSEDIAGIQTWILEEFQWLHRHPELALQEEMTTRHIKETLAGIDGVELLDLGLPTGALARIAGDPAGPVIGLRADIDALPITEASGLPYTSECPGRMHACGHDFHTAALLGVASLLAAHRQELSGTVILLFQPAEEAEHGGARVVETGLIEHYGICRMLGQHTKPGLPVGTVAIAPGPFSAAVDRFSYRIIGSGGHGSAPDRTLDPIPAAARLVSSLQEIVSRRIDPMETAVVSVTRMSSGTSWNIIPDDAELEGTVRSFSPAVRDRIVGELQARGASLRQEGYEVEFTWIPGCPATNNDPALSELVWRTAQAEGFLVEPQHPNMGGEDFSCYQERIPGAFYYIGTGGDYPAHNARFTVDPAALAPSAALMATMAQRLLQFQEVDHHERDEG